MKYEVYSEGYVIYDLNSDYENHCGRLTLQEIISEDETGEIITDEFIIDKWGGQRIKMNYADYDAEFTNGLISHGIFDSLEEAEDMMFSLAQLGEPSISIEELHKLDLDAQD